MRAKPKAKGLYLVNYRAGKKKGTAEYSGDSGADALGQFHRFIQHDAGVMPGGYKVTELLEVNPVGKVIVSRLDVPPGPNPTIPLPVEIKEARKRAAASQVTFPGMLVPGQAH